LPEVVGGTVISEQAGLTLEYTTLEALGQTRQVLVTKNSTVLSGL
jgi:hypothetical protein